MIRERVNDLIPCTKDDKKLIKVMLEDMQSLNKIAMLKEDDNVIRKFLRGMTKTNVLKYLKDKYPHEHITKVMLNNFLLLYRDVLGNQMVDIEKGYVRRLIKTKTGLNNELIDLALIAKDMVTKYDGQADNTNAVAALRAASDIFMKVAKVEGLARDTPDVNINMQMDRIVTAATSSDSEFKNAVMKIIGKPKEIVVDADFEDNNE